MTTPERSMIDRLENDMGLICDGYRKCTAQATYIVKAHQIDQCRNSECTADGDRVFILCPTCTDLLARRIGEQVGEIYAMLPDDADEIEVCCDTCGRRVLEMHDVYKVENLREM